MVFWHLVPSRPSIASEGPYPSMWLSLVALEKDVHGPSGLVEETFSNIGVERTRIASSNRGDVPCRGQIARIFRRKSAVFARNSQNKIAIASDGKSHL